MQVQYEWKILNNISSIMNSTMLRAYETLTQFIPQDFSKFYQIRNKYTVHYYEIIY